MIFTLVLAFVGVTAECKEGIHDEPLLIVRAEKTHYVHFLPGEMELCKRYATRFQNQQIKIVCGCRILRKSEERSQLRLNCITSIGDNIYSNSIMWFYYYPELTAECKRVQRILMVGGIDG